VSGTRLPGGDEREARRARWDDRHAASEPIESDAPNEALVSAVSSLEPGRALDLGCGDGVNAVWLARSGWTVTAVDFSEIAIGRGRQRAADAGVEIGWVVADLLDFEAEAQAYDLVAVLFIHLPPNERRDLLIRAAAAVAPGGRLFVVGHDRTNLTEGTGGPQDPEVLFTAEEVAADLPGLRIESTATVRRRGSAERGPIDAVVVATRSRDAEPSTS
jgi:2-polyprenyl-3-methyl-5-hydroxy-6-metoxy-1,4-benzoquinol methylase